MNQNIMMQIKHLATITLLALVLSGCSGKKDTVPDHPPAVLYATAQEKLQEGNFKAAITQLEALDNRFPFGPYSQQAQLDLIYAYYKSTDYALTQTSIDRFIRLNPTDPNIDYVYYMRGLTNMALEENFMQNLLNIDRSDRDPQFSRTAFRDLNHLVRTFPNSEYSTDSIQRLIGLKNRLARYELAVAEYYTARGAYVAVTNRVEQMLRDYPDTEATRRALPLMEASYHQLQLPEQAKKAAKVIAANHPG